MDATRFRVLGPVEAWTDERQLTLAGPQQVALLAFLLVNANRAVSVDAVIDAIWGAEREGAARHRLQMCVLRLRRALAPLDRQDGPRLRTVSSDYLLSVGTDELDAEVFARRARDGRRTLEDGDAARASELLTQAVAVWRGPLLAEVAFEDFAQAEIRRLEELRLVVLALELGRLRRSCSRHGSRRRRCARIGRSCAGTAGRALPVLAAPTPRLRTGLRQSAAPARWSGWRADQVRGREDAARAGKADCRKPTV